MRNYFPKRPSGAPLHTLSKLYDVPVGFVPPPHPILRLCIALFAVAEGGCCSISDDLTCSCYYPSLKICMRHELLQQFYLLIAHCLFFFLLFRLANYYFTFYFQVHKGLAPPLRIPFEAIIITPEFHRHIILSFDQIKPKQFWKKTGSSCIK